MPDLVLGKLQLCRDRSLRESPDRRKPPSQKTFGRGIAPGRLDGFPHDLFLRRFEVNAGRASPSPRPLYRHKRVRDNPYKNNARPRGTASPCRESCRGSPGWRKSFPRHGSPDGPIARAPRSQAKTAQCGKSQKRPTKVSSAAYTIDGTTNMDLWGRPPRPRLGFSIPYARCSIASRFFLRSRPQR